jgi:hypothetical protein
VKLGDDVRLPEGAEERAWHVVRAAYEERIPAQPPRRALRPALALAAVLALGAAAISPPGRAVLDSIRESIGVEKAQPALFSLPAPGRLIVVSAEHGGAWVLRPDGSKRRLGDYEDAQWSPNGLFVVATKRNELVALEPNGDVRWTLARRDVRSPRWAGTRTDTRIAYVARSGLRVVAGDGTGDRLLERFARLPAWHPSARHRLAYVLGDQIVYRAVDENRVLWRVPIGADLPRQLEWSADGQRLLLAADHELRVLDAQGRRLRTIRPGALVVAAEWSTTDHAIAVQLRRGESSPETRRSEVRLVDADRSALSRLLFAGAGAFGDLAWSPNGRWLLVVWRDADQWLFLRVRGRPTVRAVANIAEQFPREDGQGSLLFVEGRWCCPP